VVPSTKGLTLAGAQAALAAAGLGAEVAAGSPDALVVSQSPAAGSTLELGALVRLTFAAQPAPSTSP
jgi:beta-lactam-binding protein with PASTA domain